MNLYFDPVRMKKPDACPFIRRKISFMCREAPVVHFFSLQNAAWIALTQSYYIEMKPFRQIYFFLLILISVIVSCTDENFSIGGNLIDEDLRVVYIDTCTVRMSTVPIDSLITSGTGMVLTGRYSDTLTGSTTGTAFLTYTVPGSLAPPESAPLIFDSIELVLALNGEWTGDTTTVHDFNIYSLEEVVQSPEDEDFYNTNSIKHSTGPIAVLSLKPKPETKDTIAVRLPDYLGNDLFDKIITDDQEILSTQDRFSAYFKGLAFGPGEMNNCILGFNLSDTSMALKIYYHYVSDSRVEDHLFISPLDTRSFYGTKTDRSTTMFRDLNKKEIPSKLSNDISFTQSLTATFIKFEVPYLNNLLEAGKVVSVTDAKLKIKPLKGTYSKINPLPPSLSMYILDKNDVTMGYLVTSSGENLQTGDLIVDDVLDFETYYTYNVTEYINDQLGALEIDKKNMTIVLPQDRISKCLNTLVVGDSPKEKSIELQISYIVYDEN